GHLVVVENAVLVLIEPAKIVVRPVRRSGSAFAAFRRRTGHHGRPSAAHFSAAELGHAGIEAATAPAFPSAAVTTAISAPAVAASLGVLREPRHRSDQEHGNAQHDG